MKKFAFAALVIAIAFSASASDVIKRGAAISPDAKSVTAEQIVEKPDAYSKKPVVVEGVVSSVCTNMGCWMELGDMHIRCPAFLSVTEFDLPLREFRPAFRLGRRELPPQERVLLVHLR